MKEKIGKLIELLNEYERETFPEEHEYIEFPDGTYDDGGYWYYEEDPSLGEQEGFNYTSRGDKRNSELNQLLIISKKFGFIKRLVDNDKIDVHKIDTIATLLEEGEDVKMILRDSRCSLIMALSISDNPIEDLISYLR